LRRASPLHSSAYRSGARWPLRYDGGEIPPQQAVFFVVNQHHKIPFLSVQYANIGHVAFFPAEMLLRATRSDTHLFIPAKGLLSDREIHYAP